MGGILALAIWLLLVFLPAFGAGLGLDFYFSAYFLQSRIGIEPQLYTELQFFSEDLDEKTYIQEKLEAFDRQNHFVTSDKLPSHDVIERLQNGDAALIRQNLEKQLKFPVMAVFACNADSQNVSFNQNQKIAVFGEPSLAFIRRMFWLFNEQENSPAIFPNAIKKAFPPGTNLSDRTLQKNYSVNFLQKLFATAFAPKIEAGVIHETVGAKIGRTGNLFFYYSRARGAQHNLAAYIAVFRLQDIPEKLITDFAVGRTVNPELVRRLGFSSTRLPQPDDFNNHELSGFRQEDERYSLMAILPQVPMVRRIQKGTIFPGDFSSFNGKTAVIEVNIPNSLLQHPLQKFSRQIKFLIMLLSLFATVILLRLWLFGFAFKASISLKIALATIFCSLLPISGLFIFSGAYQEYQRRLDVEAVRRFIETRALLLQGKLADELSRYKSNTDALSALIVEKDNFEEAFLERLFSEWCRENAAVGVLFQKFDRKSMYYIVPEFRNDPEFISLWELKKIFFKSVIEFIFSSPIFSSTSESYSTVLTEGTNNAPSVHTSLISDGELINISRFSFDSRMSGKLVKKGDSGKTMPFAYLGVDYSVEKVFENSYSRLLKDFSFQDEFANHKTDVALFKISGNDIKAIESCYSPNINPDLLIKQIKQLGRIRKNLLKSHRDQEKQYHSIFLFSASLPYVTVVQASQPLQPAHDFFRLALLFYPLLVLAASLLFSQIFFVQPSRQLHLGLSEIAEGNLQKKIEIISYDEFMQLSEDLNLMTKSLLEKEQLEKFVSPDVIREINRHTEAEMLPGGEKISATVLFSTYRAIARDASSDAIVMVERLDLFLGICNSICSNNHGIIDKIIGNTIMMVFRGEFTGASHAERACRAGLQIHQAMLNNDSFKCRCCSGISSGIVVSGKIGSVTGKLDFTVIGDTANTAARLKSLAEKLDGSNVIISQSTAAQVGDEFKMKELEPVGLKGKQGKHRTWAIS